jgi:heme oxygenase
MQGMLNASQIDSLAEEQLREATRGLTGQFEQRDRGAEAVQSEILFKSNRIGQPAYELARQKRVRFDRSSEKLDRAQARLREEALDADLAAIGEEPEQLQSTPPARKDKSVPRREPLPDRLRQSNSS